MVQGTTDVNDPSELNLICSMMEEATMMDTENVHTLLI
jgi:hypothetical protein